ncbi:MAG: tetratricopeptide repeat protein [Thiogranum sp.]
MKQLPSLLSLTLALSLGGCSLFSRFDDDSYATVGSLSPDVLPAVPAGDPGKDRAEATRHYQAFLQESPDSEHAPEAIRRLADLQLAAEQDAIEKGTSLTGQQSRAAQLYEELLERYPDRPDNDSALYQLARAYDQTGATEPSIQALTRYTEMYKTGSKYDEAQFRRGEYLFIRRDYAQAEQAYQAVIDSRGPDSPFHQQALYKLGWSHFKQGHYQAALDAYMQLLDESIPAHDSASPPDYLIRTEQERLNDTLRAVSLGFSYLGDSGTVRDYFQREGKRNYEPLVYSNLAALHLSKERYTDAAEIYSLFASVHPQHYEAPLFQSNVIDVYRKAGFGERVLAEKEAFVLHYEPASDYWKQHDPAQSPYILPEVQRHLRDVARHYHAVAQQKDEPGSYAQAGRWYQLYLRAFPDSEQAPYMNFLYAELLTSGGQHGLAAVQYEHTAYEYGEHRKSSEAGYAALLAYQKHEATLKGAARADWHRAGIDSALRFSESFPEHKQALPVRTLAAQQLYALKDYATAIDAAQPVAENPDAPAGLQLSAWTVIAHARFDQEDYQRAESAYRQVLARTAANSEKRGKLQEKLAASIYKQGEQERAAGNLLAAAEHFLRIRDSVPESAINVTAQYDAAAAYIALKQWPAAIRILEQWRAGYPGNKLQDDVTAKLAVLYRENGQPLQAAVEFERISRTQADPALRREAAWTSATLYQQAGREQQAIAAYIRFAEQYPQPVEQAMEARYQLVQLFRKTGTPDRVRYWQQQIVKSDKAAGRARTDRTRFLAAHARLALVAADREAYESVKLKEPLKKNLARKKKYMQASIKGYNEAAAYNVSEVTTQATYRIGELYAGFGEALLASERPRNLNADELEQYDILLEEQAYPFEEKAIEVHEANAQRIADGLYDEWVRNSMRALAELMPVRYAKEEKGEDFVAMLQ